MTTQPIDIPEEQVRFIRDAVAAGRYTEFDSKEEISTYFEALE